MEGSSSPAGDSGRPPEASASESAIRKVQSRLADLGLLVGVLVGIPVAALLFIRGISAGGMAVAWVDAGILAIALAAVLAGDRLPFAARAGILVGALWLGGASALVEVGPAAPGVAVLLATCLVAALVAGPRWGLVVLAASTVFLLVAYRWFPAGRAAPEDFSELLVSPVAWASRIGVFLMIGVSALLIVRRYVNALRGAIDHGEEQRVDLRRALERLEREAEERRKAEETLRRTMYSLDQAKTAIFWLRADSSFIYGNEASAKLLDCTVDEVLKTSAIEIDVGLDDEKWPSLLSTLRSQGEVVVETELVRRSGGLVPVQITANHAVFQNSEYVFAIVHDVTERQVIEQEAAELRTELERARKMEAVGRLAGGIAHDFNNQLQAIRGNAELVVEELPASTPVQEEAREIVRAVDRAAELVRRLLTFSRQLPIERKVIDLAAEVRSTGHLLKRLIGENIALGIETGDEPLTVEADPAQLEQVLLNLALNARDAMPDGGVLSIVAEREGEWVELTVTDDGAGIETDLLEKIFEPFFTTKGPTEGTGLGLAVVYGIVEDHGGSLSVESSVGKGSRFRVRLPMVDGIVEEAAEVHDGGVARYGDETVLLVEDDDAVRAVISRALTDRGFRVLPANDAEEALRLFDEHLEQVACLVLDVVLPGRSGIDIYRDAAQAKPGIPVVFSSGYGAERVEKEILDRRGVRRLQKPYSGDDLAVAVRSVLDAAGGA